MPRPRRFRRVRFQPGITYFKPAGVRMTELDEVILAFDEFEAIRLKDFENIDQEEAAKKMNISQPTFHRLINAARKKIADALVYGKAIRIEGGNYKMVQPRGSGQGRGMSRGGGFALGPGGNCVCPKCGYSEVHARGQPCFEKTCPKCSTRMTRSR